MRREVTICCCVFVTSDQLNRTCSHFLHKPDLAIPHSVDASLGLQQTPAHKDPHSLRVIQVRHRSNSARRPHHCHTHYARNFLPLKARLREQSGINARPAQTSKSEKLSPFRMA